ncbi:MAG: protein kinase domain-containing protein [Vicinamibacterales bacterium]
MAIKVLSPQYSRDPDRLRRFEQEARAAGMLNHPNVLAIDAVGKEGDSPYLVTELLEGTTLHQRLASGAVAEGRALEFADQIVQGLAAAHEHGIVHRDLKPENIFITRDGRVKILDFGLAKLTQSGSELDAPTRTASGIAVGTPAYMSPEQLRGARVDHRADIFALGAVMYEMLAGRRAFVRDTSVETMNAILKEEPPPLSGASPQIEQIVRHCLEKDPADRYQSARDLGFQLRLARESSPQTFARRPRRGFRRRVMLAVAGVILLAAATLTWWLTRARPSTTTATFTRLTFDAGLTSDPAFSPDGHLVAYASDRGGTGNLDIWRQQLATREAVRLTSDPADESEPTFSPGGSRITFRSERDGGGVYVVSAFGGEPRLIAPQGRRPRFSPDGIAIAYWVSVGPWYIGKVFVVPAVGGTPTPIEPGFASATYPIWSPDSRHLLFLGARDPTDIPTQAHDWWFVPKSGGPAVKTGASEIYKGQGLGGGRQVMSSLIAPADWVGDSVFFSGLMGESTNLWRISVSAVTGKAEGTAQRLTSGTSVEVKPSVIAGDRIVFASLRQDLNIWSVPIAANAGRVTGDLQQVTGSAFDAHTSLSTDGRKLVFISTRSGNPDVWMKDLVTGRETALTATPSHEEQSEISADGTRVSYVVWENASTSALYEIATTGGVPERICDNCFRQWDWSADGSKLLFMIPEGHRQPGLAIGVFDRTTRQTSVYLEHPDYILGRARVSPDGRWISFSAIRPGRFHRIVIVPFQHRGVAEDQWITIAEETTPQIAVVSRWPPPVLRL